MAADPKRITELDEATTIPSASWFGFVDTTITTMAPSGTDFKVRPSNLVKGLLPSQAGQAGKVLSTDGSVLSWASGGGGGSGTVTSVGLTMPSGFSVAGSPVTGSGTLAVTTALSGVLKGSGGAIVAAASGTDYLTPTGSGAGLTALNASALASGTVASARLPADVAYTDVANTFTVAPESITIDADAHKGLIVKAHSPTQSANLQEWQDSSGTALASIGPGCQVVLKSAGVTTITTDVGNSSGTLVVNPTATNSATINALNRGYSGIDVAVVLDGDADLTPTLSGIKAGINSKATSARDYTNVAGLTCQVDHMGSGTMGVVQSLIGQAFVHGTARIGTMLCIYAYVDRFDSGTGTFDSVFGVYVDRQYSDCVTGSAYGLFVDDQSAGGAPTSFNICSLGPNANNTFEGRVDAGRSTPGDAAAILQADSTTKGFLPPRMTTAQRDAISLPPEGLVLYNTTTHKLTYRNASTWVEV